MVRFSIFRSRYTTLGPAAGSSASGCNSTIVVPLHERHLHIFEQQVLLKDLQESNFVRKVEEREAWCKIVNENFRQEAILLLMHSSPDWKDCKLTETAVNSGFLVARYEELAGSQNMRQLPAFFIDFTFADILSNPRMNFGRLKPN